MGRHDTTERPGAARRVLHEGRPPRSRRPLAAAAAALALIPMLTGCYLLDPDLLAEGTETVSLEVGETAQVDLGEWSPGVGDDWGPVPSADGDAAAGGTAEGVAAEDGTVDDGVATARVVTSSEVFGVRERHDDGSTGGSYPYAIELTGLAPGTSTVRVIYCYRTAITEGCDQGARDIDPIELTVTVS